MPPKVAAEKAKAKGKAKAKKEDGEEDFGIEKVPEPDQAAYDAKSAEITETIDKLQAQQKAITDEIQQRSGGRDEFFQQKKELQMKLDAFNETIGVLDAKKKAINKTAGDQRQEAADKRSELMKQKKALGFTTEEEIDDRIRFLEVKLRTETLKLKEEKDIMKEIADLKKRKPEVAKVKKLEESVAIRDTGVNFKEQVGEINAQLNEYWEGKKQVLAQMKELTEARNAKMGDTPDKIKEREELGAKIKEQIALRNELREEFSKEKRAFNDYLRQVREKRQEKWVAEKKARDAEWEKQKLIRAAEKLDQQPYVTEMTLIEQTIAFCKSLTGTKEEKAAEEKKEVTHNNPDGTEILARKEDREEEFYFAPTAKKKSKSKNKGNKAEGGAKAIKHNAATFKLFDELKLEAPITTDDIPATLEKLEQQLESYKGKVKEWEEHREEMKRKILEDGVLPDQEKAGETAATAEETAE